MRGNGRAVGIVERVPQPGGNLLDLFGGGFVFAAFGPVVPFGFIKTGLFGQKSLPQSVGAHDPHRVSLAGGSQGYVIRLRLDQSLGLHLREQTGGLDVGMLQRPREAIPRGGAVQVIVIEKVFERVFQDDPVQPVSPSGPPAAWLNPQQIPENRCRDPNPNARPKRHTHTRWVPRKK